jgi:hypothetical protein
MCIRGFESRIQAALRRDGLQFDPVDAPRPRRGRRVLMALACAFGAANLAACGSISEKFSHVLADAPGIGLPAGTPDRPVTAAAYPAVHDMPPARPAVLSSQEQIKMEDQLVAARTRQQALAHQPTGQPATSPIPAPAAPAATPRRNVTPPAGSAPRSSSTSIY